jgi:hypothetical protein
MSCRRVVTRASKYRNIGINEGISMNRGGIGESQSQMSAVRVLDALPVYGPMHTQLSASGESVLMIVCGLDGFG